MRYGIVLIPKMKRIVLGEKRILENFATVQISVGFYIKLAAGTVDQLFFL